MFCGRRDPPEGIFWTPVWSWFGPVLDLFWTCVWAPVDRWVKDSTLESCCRKVGSTQIFLNSVYMQCVHIPMQFMLCEYVSACRKVAEKNNLNPGSHIAIHGLPSLSILSQYLYNGSDWTDGCIALNNSDMKELWDMSDEGIQILIKP